MNTNSSVVHCGPRIGNARRGNCGRSPHPLPLSSPTQQGDLVADHVQHSVESVDTHSAAAVLDHGQSLAGRAGLFGHLLLCQRGLAVWASALGARFRGLWDA